MLTVLGGLAEFERHLILNRTAEGRDRAKARGVRFGRKLKLTPHQRQEALERRARGEPLNTIYVGRGSSASRVGQDGARQLIQSRESRARAETVAFGELGHGRRRER